MTPAVLLLGLTLAAPAQATSVARPHMAPDGRHVLVVATLGAERYAELHASSVDGPSSGEKTGYRSDGRLVLSIQCQPTPELHVWEATMYGWEKASAWKNLHSIHWSWSLLPCQ